MANRRTRGFWLDINNLRKELVKIIEKYGTIPSKMILKRDGYSALNSAIDKHYKMSTIREMFGLECILHDISVLEKWDDFTKAFDKAIQAIGHYPSQKELSRNGFNHICVAMVRFHGGANNVRRIYGCELDVKPNQYWLEKKNIVDEALKLIDKHGQLLPSNVLQKLGYTSFVSAVSMQYGGFDKLRSDIGENLLRQPYGHWLQIENILKESYDLIDTYGFIPSESNLQKKLGKSDFVCALQKYHGGLIYFCKKYKFPYENSSQPKGYWKNINNVITELTSSISQLGYFPSQIDLTLLGKNSLREAITLHGGLNHFRKLLGYPRNQIIANDGHHCDSYQEKIIDDFLLKNDVFHKRGIKIKLSNCNAVPDFFLSDNIIVEVLMFDYRKPALSKIAERYIYKYMNKREQYLSFGYKVIEFFPTDLRSNEKFIEKYQQISESLDLETVSNIQSPNELVTMYRHSPGYWRNFKNIEEELQPICQEIKRFPTRLELKACGKGYLVSAITRHHKGMHAVASRLGFPTKRLPKNFWKNNWNAIIVGINTIAIYLGHCPNSTDIKVFHSTLIFAINNYYGGFRTAMDRYCMIQRWLWHNRPWCVINNRLILTKSIDAFKLEYENVLNFTDVDQSISSRKIVDCSLCTNEPGIINLCFGPNHQFSL